MRRDRAQFHSLGGWMNTESLYKSGGKMSTILQNSRVGKFVGEPGKNNSLFLLSAEFLPTESQFGKAEAYKALQVSEKELSKPLEWMQKAKGPATIIVALGRRVRKLRRPLEDWAEHANKAPLAYLIRDYIHLSAASDDPQTIYSTFDDQLIACYPIL